MAYEEFRTPLRNPLSPIRLQVLSTKVIAGWRRSISRVS